MRTITVEFKWCCIIPVFKNLKISKESAGKIQIKTVGKYRSCLSPGRDGLHKKCFHTGLGVNAVTADLTGSGCQRGSRHVPFVCAAKGGRRSVKVISRLGAVRLGGILCTTKASCSSLHRHKTTTEGGQSGAGRGTES